MKKLLFLLTFLGTLQFTAAPKEGIKGQVFWLSDNQMPGPGKTNSPHLGVAREILIYKAVNETEATQIDHFYKDIKTELIAKARSKEDGSFKINLPPGEYSIFTQEPMGLFANLIDGKGCVSCVVVEPKKYAWVSITVDYEAAY